MSNRRLTRDQFEAIKKHFDENLASLASQGPWDYNKQTGQILDKDDKIVCKLDGLNHSLETEANGDIIMLSRMLIPLLLDTIENGLDEEE